MLLLSLPLLILPAASSPGRDLRDTTLQADYLIICSSAYASQAGRLARYRTERNGFTTLVAPIDTIYAGFPPSESPDSSLRSFIRYAMRAWRTPRPRYIVLAGNINTVPSHKEPGLNIPPDVLEDSILADSWFVAGDDGTTAPPQAAIGRLPAWTSAELDTLISKIESYERTPVDGWMRRALVLADYNDDDGDIFEQEATKLEQSLNGGWNDQTRIDVRSESPHHEDLTGFLSAWSAGAGIVAYVGHGNPWVLSRSRYLTADDVGSLGNGTKLPICCFAACAQSFGREDSVSIVERLLLQGGGGAIAAIVSTGENYLGTVFPFLEDVLTRCVADSSVSIGEAFARTQTAAWSRPLVTRMTILGDPAIVPRRYHALATAHPAATPVYGFSLAQNYPNPFNPSTSISFTVPNSGRVVIDVLGITGAEVARIYDRHCAAGSYTVRFTASGLASGVYLLRLRAGNLIECRTMILLR